MQFIQLCHDLAMPPGTLVLNLIEPVIKALHAFLAANKPSLFLLALAAALFPVVKVAVEPFVESFVELFGERGRLAECTLLIGHA